VSVSKPLDNFSLVRSRNVEEVRDALARVYARPALVPRKGIEDFSATVNVCGLRDVAVAYGAFGGEVQFEFPATDFFLQILPIRGAGDVRHGSESIALAAGAGAIVTADSPFKANFSSDYEQLVLRIKVQGLTGKLAALTGTAINKPLRLDVLKNSGYAAAHMLRGYLPLLARTLTTAVPPFPDWWVVQTEQLLMTLFLCGYRHNYSHLLERQVPIAAPPQVRRAEEYIEANQQRAVTLEELAEVTGVSVFSLFRSFKRYRGYSPFQFLAQVRSRHGGKR
jgi:AraC-binding-like domain